MSKPKLERNLEIVEKRLKDPVKYSVRKLGEEYDFKSPATVHEILATFTPKFKALYPDKYAELRTLSTEKAE